MVLKGDTSAAFSAASSFTLLDLGGAATGRLLGWGAGNRFLPSWWRWWGSEGVEKGVMGQGGVGMVEGVAVVMVIVEVDVELGVDVEVNVVVIEALNIFMVLNLIIQENGYCKTYYPRTY